MPELKGELSLRGLPTTGNKADLVARLQADDKKNAQEAAPAGASASGTTATWTSPHVDSTCKASSIPRRTQAAPGKSQSVSASKSIATKRGVSTRNNTAPAEPSPLRNDCTLSQRCLPAAKQTEAQKSSYEVALAKAKRAAAHLQPTSHGATVDGHRKPMYTQPSTDPVFTKQAATGNTRSTSGVVANHSAPSPHGGANDHSFRTSWLSAPHASDTPKPYRSELTFSASAYEEDEIDWDDDVDASKHAAAPASAPEPAAAAEPEEPAAEPQELASEPAKTYAPDPTASESTTPAVTKSSNENTATTAEKPAEDREAEESASKQDFAANLAPTSVDEEARKRAERAKRFGLGEDSEEMKRAKRAEKFGINSSDIARGLDAALPERPAKRGRRGDWGDGGSRPAKRMTPDWRGGSGRGVRGRKGRFGGGRKGGGDRDGRVRKIESVLRDPAERAKAEARTQRFGVGGGGRK